MEKGKKTYLIIIVSIILLGIMTGCFVSVINQKQSSETIHEINVCKEVALEKAKEDIGDDCYVVFAKLRKDKTCYQVLITNEKDTHAILYDVFYKSPDNYIIRETISTKGSNATKELLR